MFLITLIYLKFKISSELSVPASLLA